MVEINGSNETKLALVPVPVIHAQEHHPEWECPKCTLLNPNNAFFCDACTYPKPSNTNDGDTYVQGNVYVDPDSIGVQASEPAKYYVDDPNQYNRIEENINANEVIGEESPWAKKMRRRRRRRLRMAGGAVGGAIVGAAIFGGPWGAVPGAVGGAAAARMISKRQERKKDARVAKNQLSPAVIT